MPFCLFLAAMMMHCNSKNASMRTEHFLYMYFNNSRITGEDLVVSLLYLDLHVLGDDALIS